MAWRTKIKKRIDNIYKVEFCDHVGPIFIFSKWKKNKNKKQKNMLFELNFFSLFYFQSAGNNYFVYPV